MKKLGWLGFCIVCLLFAGPFFSARAQQTDYAKKFMDLLSASQSCKNLSNNFPHQFSPDPNVGQFKEKYILSDNSSYTINMVPSLYYIKIISIGDENVKKGIETTFGSLIKGMDDKSVVSFLFGSNEITWSNGNPNDPYYKFPDTKKAKVIRENLRKIGLTSIFPKPEKMTERASLLRLCITDVLQGTAF